MLHYKLLQFFLSLITPEGILSKKKIFLQNLRFLCIMSFFLFSTLRSFLGRRSFVHLFLFCQFFVDISVCASIFLPIAVRLKVWPCLVRVKKRYKMIKGNLRVILKLKLQPFFPFPHSNFALTQNFLNSKVLFEFQPYF